MSSLNNISTNTRSMNGLSTVNADSVNTNNLDVDTLVVNTSAICPTMPTADNSNNVATTAYVQSHTSGNYVTIGTTQTITGEKTFSNTNTFVSGNLVTNSIQADVPTNNINIGTQLTTGDVNIGTIASTGQNVALNWGTSSNSGQLTFRGGSFTLSSTGNYTQQSGGSLTTSIDTNKTTGAFNMLTGANWSGTANICNNNATTATGTVNIGGTYTTTNINGNTTINKLKGQYIDLFAGQLRMFSGSAGGSAIYFYVPPSGRSIMDFSTTNCDMVGQYNLTSNNITCSIAPTTADEYTNKNYVDSNFVDLTTTQTISGVKSINSYLKFTNTFNGQYGSIGYNALNQWLSLSSTNNFNINAGGNTTYSNGGGIFNIKSNTLGVNTILNLNDNYDNTLFKFDCSGTANTIYSYYPLTINATNPIFTSNARCSTAPSNSNDYCNKDYVDTVSNYSNLLSSNNTWSGSNTFNNFAVNQTTGDVNITLNSSTQKVNIVRGTNTINFSTNAGPALNSSSTTTPFIISAGSGATSAGFNLNPTGGLGEGGEMIIGSTLYSGKNLWIDGTNGGIKSFGSNNIRIYNPFSYSYNPSTITWGSPSSNTINGWTNSPTNDGQTYSGTASDNSTPANVGQIVLPAPGIWFLQVSALITLNTGSDTITDRTIVVSDIGTTDSTPCTVGFAYRDPIDDGAGSAGNRQIVNFSGIYHFVDVSSGTRTLYINAIVITSGTRTVTVSGNYKYTRIG